MKVTAPHKTGSSALLLAGEFVAALAMLAILILTFAPVTPANSILSSASVSGTIAIDASWCGDPLSGDQSGHAGACHACRYDLAELPDPSCVNAPAFATLDATRGPTGKALLLPAQSILAHDTRAPPHTV